MRAAPLGCCVPASIREMDEWSSPRYLPSSSWVQPRCSLNPRTSIRSDMAINVHYAHCPVKAKCTPATVHNAHMAKIQEFSDQALRLRAARIERGFEDAKAAAKFFGWNYTTYSQHERGERGLKRETAAKYAKAFRKTAGWLITGDSDRPGYVPIVGYAGASPDGSILFGDGDSHFGEVALPYGAGPNSVAVEVRGDSMRGIAEDGWLVFYEERREPPTDDLIGEYCIVGLPDGRVLIKKLARGRKKKHFDLESAAGATIYDAKVEWAAPVSAIVPRRSARSAITRP